MPDSVVALEALALHAVCEMYTKEEGICTSGEEAEAAKANAALHDARGSWLAAMNCLPAVYLSVLKHRARSDQHSDAWEWGRSRPAEVRACMKAARPTEMRQVCVMAPSARRVTALVARKALDDSHEVKRARFNPSGSVIHNVDAPLSGGCHLLWRPTGTPWGRAEACTMY